MSCDPWTYSLRSNVNMVFVLQQSAEVRQFKPRSDVDTERSFKRLQTWISLSLCGFKNSFQQRIFYFILQLSQNWDGGWGVGVVMEYSMPSLFSKHHTKKEDTGMLTKDSATELLFKPEANSKRWAIKPLSLPLSPLLGNSKHISITVQPFFKFFFFFFWGGGGGDVLAAHGGL